MADRERVTLSVDQATTIAGVARRTIYNWIDAGKVEFIRAPSGAIRIFEDTLWRRADGSALPALPDGVRFIRRGRD